MENSVLIYMIDPDEAYGIKVKNRLAFNHFENFAFFSDTEECLKNMNKKPKILIVSAHLKSFSGIQLIKKARATNPKFFSILLSGESDEDPFKICDDRFLQFVDKYIIKGMDDLEEIIETVCCNFAEG